MAKLSTAEIDRYLKSVIGPSAPLTTYSSGSYADEAFKSGADGYLVKHAAPSELPIAIATVLRGCQYRSPQISKQTRGTA